MSEQLLPKSATVADLTAPEQMEPAATSAEPNQSVIPLENRVHELEAALDQEREISQGLRRQLREMGDRVARLQEQQGNPNVRSLLIGLRKLAEDEKRTISKCTRDLDQLQEQIEEVMRDRGSAERNLASLITQIERLEGQLEETSHTNGHLAGVN